MYIAPPDAIEMLYATEHPRWQFNYGYGLVHPSTSYVHCVSIYNLQSIPIPIRQRQFDFDDLPRAELYTPRGNDNTVWPTSSLHKKTKLPQRSPVADSDTDP